MQRYLFLSPYPSRNFLFSELVAPGNELSVPKAASVRGADASVACARGGFRLGEVPRAMRRDGHVALRHKRPADNATLFPSYDPEKTTKRGSQYTKHRQARITNGGLRNLDARRDGGREGEVRRPLLAISFVSHAYWRAAENDSLDETPGAAPAADENHA